MDNWHPSVAYEVGQAIHQDRLARSLTQAEQVAGAAPRRTIREALGQGLLALAMRLAPELEIAAASRNTARPAQA
jgi:hypothetical protein